jgi:hypothetical protein
MFKQLRRLFSIGDPLIELARSGDSSLFKETFCASEVFVVSKAGSITLDPESMTADDLQEMMEEAAHEIAEERPFPAFTYGPEGREVLPVFSCREAAETFVRRYVQAVNRVIPFAIASLEGSSLLPFLDGTIRMTLNPLTDSELELPRDLQAELVR